MQGHKLSGQVAWVTGAASGIGRATAELLAREGASVALVDTNLEEGRKVLARISHADGQAIFLACDVSRENQVRDSIEATVKHFGALHIIVNCAAIGPMKLLHESSEEDWDRVMGTNVKAIFFSIKHGISHLRKNRRSYVVNIGSVGSFVGQASTPAYITSKGAVLQLSRSIALDYAADGVRCNCVCPGITDTPALRRHLNTTPDPEATLIQRLSRVPMGVLLKPEDIAKAVLYLSCEDSAGVTGTSLAVDGGYLAVAEWETKGRTAFMEETV